MNMLDIILNTVFPEVCLLCGCTCERIPANIAFPICPSCFASLPFRQSYFSRIPAVPEDLLFCSALVCPLSYSGEIPQAISEHKFRGVRAFSLLWGALIAKMLYRQNLVGRIDIIIPVPLHIRRLRHRGYNQAEDIAIVISKLTGIPTCTDGLTRICNTLPQSTLDRRRRLSADGHAFNADSNVLYGKRVLLVDDVVTTGSTLERCGKACAAAGTLTVIYAAAATGRAR